MNIYRGETVIDEDHEAKGGARFLRHPGLLTLGKLGVAGIGFWYSKPLRQFGKYRRALGAGGPAHDLQSHWGVSTVSYGGKRPFARKARRRRE